MHLRNFFDYRARFYERIFSLPVIKKMEQDEVSKIAALANVRGKRVLDIGCGHGKFSKIWREKGASLVVGIDFSKNMLQQAKKKSACSFLLCDAFTAPFKDKSFDLVTCIGVANYYYDVAPLLSEMRRLSADVVMLTFPNKSFWGRVYAGVSRVKIYLRDKKEAEQICASAFKECAVQEIASGLTLLVR